MKKISLILGLILILFSSCTKKIDGSNEESMKSSIAEIKESLNEEKKAKFQEAVGLIMLEGVDFESIMENGGKGNTNSAIVAKLDGKSADEVIAEGQRILAEIERKKKDQAKSEIIELYKKKEQAEKDLKELEKFKIIRSRFSKRQTGKYYVREEPIIELTVINGTNKAVSRAYFIGTLGSPNRSVPWLKDEFNYEIPGGLEPNEEATWRLAPSRYSKWGLVEAPKDAILTVEVTSLTGANGDNLYSKEGFGEYEKNRLEELLTNYPEFKKIEQN